MQNSQSHSPFQCHGSVHGSIHVLYKKIPMSEQTPVYIMLLSRLKLLRILVAFHWGVTWTKRVDVADTYMNHYTELAYEHDH